MRISFAFLLVTTFAIPLLPHSSGQPPAGKTASAKDIEEEPLPKGALERFGSMRLRHTGPVSSLAWSHDGAWLASGSHDRTICIWDAETGQRLKRFSGHEDAVFAIALSSDSKLLASAGRDKTVRLWEVSSGKLLWKIEAHEDTVCCVAFSPDDSTIATGGKDAKVRLWDAAKGKRVRQLADVADEMSPPHVFWQSLLDGEKMRVAWKVGVHAVAFSPDGKLLASAGENKAVRLWEVKTGKKINELATTPHANIHGVAFSPDGGTVVSASMENAATCIWDLTTGKVLSRLEGDGSIATGVTFSCNGNRLVLCPANGCGRVRVSDAKTGRCQCLFDAGNDPIFAVALSRDDKTLAWAGAGAIIRLVDAATGDDRMNGMAARVNLNDITKTPENKLPARVRADTAALWAFSQDARMLVYVDQGKNLHVWDVANSKEIQEFALPYHVYQRVSGLALSPEGTVLAVVREPEGNETGEALIYLFDSVAGKMLRTLERSGRNQPREGLAFSPDERSLVASNWFGEVCVWEVATGKQRSSWQTSLFNLNRMKFSSDGRLLATASAGSWGYPSQNICPDRFEPPPWPPSTVRLWDLATTKEIACFDGHINGVWDLAFFARGKQLASVGAEGLGFAWAVPDRVKATTAAALAPNETENVWDCLAADHTKTPVGQQKNTAVADAYVAQCKLIASGQAAKFLKTKLKPVPHADLALVESYRKALDSDKYAERETASNDLKNMGPAAEPILRKLLEGNPTLELRRRAELLLEPFNTGWTPERLRLDRSLEVLERLGDAEARAVLKTLADGAPGIWLTRQAQASLDRL